MIEYNTTSITHPHLRQHITHHYLNLNMNALLRLAHRWFNADPKDSGKDNYKRISKHQSRKSLRSSRPSKSRKSSRHISQISVVSIKTVRHDPSTLKSQEHRGSNSKQSDYIDQGAVSNSGPLSSKNSLQASKQTSTKEISNARSSMHRIIRGSHWFLRIFENDPNYPLASPPQHQSMIDDLARVDSVPRIQDVVKGLELTGTRTEDSSTSDTELLENNMEQSRSSRLGSKSAGSSVYGPTPTTTTNTSTSTSSRPSDSSLLETYRGTVTTHGHSDQVLEDDIVTYTEHYSRETGPLNPAGEDGQEEEGRDEKVMEFESNTYLRRASWIYYSPFDGFPTPSLMGGYLTSHAPLNDGGSVD